MDTGNLIFILSIAIQSSTAVLFATIGEIFTERSGVLNLGVEGMMLMGALSGFAATAKTGGPSPANSKARCPSRSTSKAARAGSAT